MWNCFKGMAQLHASGQRLSPSVEPKQLYLSRGHHLLPFLSLTTLTCESCSGLPTEPSLLPFSACNPSPPAALCNVRARGKHQLVSLWPISACLYRSMRWRNEISLLTGSHIVFLAKVLKTETAHVHDTSLKPSGFYGCSRLCFQRAS